MPMPIGRALPALFILVAVALASCGRPTAGAVTDITGVMPALAFHMTRANDGASVSALSYRGKVVVLYFGYTHCPDECPTTLANLATVLRRLGNKAQDVRVLFVSVDPARDAPGLLRSYVKAFAPEIDGLRGSDNAIAALARRYRVIYSVTPASPGHPYTVMHSASTFFFDRNGNARLVTMSTDDAAMITAQLRRLLGVRR
jgi:protein SCO1